MTVETEMGRNDGARGDASLWIAAAVAVLAGLVVRIRNLRWQIFSDDEWHALNSAVGESYAHLLTSFSGYSASPPLQLTYKILHDTIGLSETIMRMPMLIVGILTPIVFAWVLPKRFNPRTRCLFAILLAVSPILIYYSRYARPYSISLFCTFVGVIAFFRWWSGEGRRWAVPYVLCAVIGPYFHLTVMPSLLAPFLFALADAWHRRPDSRSQRRRAAAEARDDRVAPHPSLRELGALGIACALGIGLLLGAPLVLDWGSISARGGYYTVQIDTIVHSLPLLAGTAHGWLIWLLTLLSGCGAVLLARQWPRFATFAVWITLCTVIPPAFTNTLGIVVPVVFVRYVLWIVPAFSLFLAIALDRGMRRLGDRGASLAMAGLAIGLLFLGPIPATYGRVNSWTHHAIYQYTYSDSNPFSYAPGRKPLRIPDFYRRLGHEPAGSLIIAEAPWYYEWHNNPLSFYQEIHQQWVKSGSLGRACRQLPPTPWGFPGRSIQHLPEKADHLSLRNSVDISMPEELAVHEVDYVVLHKDLWAEIPDLLEQDERWVPASNVKQPRGFADCIVRYRELAGNRVAFEDRDLVVLDVRHLKTVGR